MGMGSGVGTGSTGASAGTGAITDSDGVEFRVSDAWGIGVSAGAGFAVVSSGIYRDYTKRSPN